MKFNIEGVCDIIAFMDMRLTMAKMKLMGLLRIALHLRHFKPFEPVKEPNSTKQTLDLRARRMRGY